MNRLVRRASAVGLLLFVSTSALGCAVDANGSEDDGESTSSEELAAGAFKVMSYNLRYQQDVDTGVRRWEHRKASVFARIAANDPDVFGVQEAKRPAGDIDYPAEVKAGVKADGDAYDVFDPGGGSPKLIFWKKTRFALAEATSAANELDLPSGSDKSCAEPTGKKAVWVKLRDKQTAKIYFVVNTHLSPGAGCPDARLQSAIAIKKLVNAESDGLPVIIFGDLNNDPQSKALATEETIHFFEKRGQDLTLANDYAGTTTNAEATFNSSWSLSVTDTDRIDYLFHSSGISVLKTKIDRTANADGISPSDHFPLIVTLK